MFEQPHTSRNRKEKEVQRHQIYKQDEQHSTKPIKEAKWRIF